LADIFSRRFPLHLQGVRGREDIRRVRLHILLPILPGRVLLRRPARPHALRGKSLCEQSEPVPALALLLQLFMHAQFFSTARTKLHSILTALRSF
jgi:hypothetical protein